MSLSKDALNELFEYKEGKLYNKIDRGRVKSGELSGTLDNSKGKGYYRVKLYAKSYYVHRIIYIMHHGHIPRNLVIDHINRDKTDNRIENLRVVTRMKNTWNTDSKGVCFDKRSGKFMAYIMTNKKRSTIGYFSTEQDALDARKIAEKQRTGA